MDVRLPHLFLSTPPERNDYINVSQGGAQKRIPARNREQHSMYLEKRLHQAWDEAKNEYAAYYIERNGIYLEFRSDPGKDLVFKSLENLTSKKIRLLNVKKLPETDQDNSPEVTYATVYVDNEKKDFFFDKIEQYATKETEKGKPRNADLINSINDIRKALLVESFWQDTYDLIPSNEPEWCEVWLSSDSNEIIENFENLLTQQLIISKPGFIRFPERAVKIICSTRAQLEMLSRLSDNIAEYRRAKQTTAFWTELSNHDTVEWVESFLKRLDIDFSSNTSICILDTGVNNGHPLLNPILKDNDCQSAEPEWKTHDHRGHGTLMAGVSAYGDLKALLSNNARIYQKVRLESVKILPPPYTHERTPPELWGNITARAISRAEIQSPELKRIICMAVTADGRDRGRPSSWSAALDNICSGAEDDTKRILLVSAGNADINGTYPDSQYTDSIQDPAQSWNALTVGAYTSLDVISHPQYRDYIPIAPKNGLSPFSTTSVLWENKWPIKPEIVMEGGNAAITPNNSMTECDDLCVLSTFYRPHENHFCSFNMTSAATAQASWFAAQIQAQYPNYWPETIRALMVHSAEWTETLIKQFNIDLKQKGSILQLLRICGYGVPDLNRAIYCASNSLTLIAQSELQPFDKRKTGSGYETKDMHLYNLPWPRDVLLNLPPTTEVKMRVTLSYYIEPGPGEIGWQDRYRYPSHTLRFDINSPGESKDDFVRRINLAARDEEDEHPETLSATHHWLIGPSARNKGSIHSDIWQGTAAELATSNIIAVCPRVGWWRERSHLNKWGRSARYALIVSISTTEQEVDIYTPVAIQLEIPVTINSKIS